MLGEELEVWHNQSPHNQLVVDKQPPQKIIISESHSDHKHPYPMLKRMKRETIHGVSQGLQGRLLEVKSE
jgi:hypothetical protein